MIYLQLRCFCTAGNQESLTFCQAFTMSNVLLSSSPSTRRVTQNCQTASSTEVHRGVRAAVPFYRGVAPTTRRCHSAQNHNNNHPICTDYRAAKEQRAPDDEFSAARGAPSQSSNPSQGSALSPDSQRSLYCAKPLILSKQAFRNNQLRLADKSHAPDCSSHYDGSCRRRSS